MSEVWGRRLLKISPLRLTQHIHRSQRQLFSFSLGKGSDTKATKARFVVTDRAYQPQSGSKTVPLGQHGVTAHPTDKSFPARGTFLTEVTVLGLGPHLCPFCPHD